MEVFVFRNFHTRIKMSHSVLKDVLPTDYGFVVLVAADGLFMHFYLGKKVVSARKEYNVKVRRAICLL